MRLEYRFELTDVDTPRFAVEAVEGIGKLFTLATLVLNVLHTKQRIEIVFHGLNPEDPERKIHAFQQILESCEGHGTRVRVVPGSGGRIPDSSSYFQWLRVEKP